MAAEQKCCTALRELEELKAELEATQEDRYQLQVRICSFTCMSVDGLEPCLPIWGSASCPQTALLIPKA